MYAFTQRIIFNTDTDHSIGQQRQQLTEKTSNELPNGQINTMTFPWCKNKQSKNNTVLYRNIIYIIVHMLTYIQIALYTPHVHIV